MACSRNSRLDNEENVVKTVEDAYSQMASSLAGAQGLPLEWSKIVFHGRLLSGNCSSMTTRFESAEVSGSTGLGMQLGLAVDEAAIFLRDDLLRTTGQRIWGLTFTLYPSGQFNIEYDYNKPADYEDSDETISLSEALQGLGVDVQVAGLPPKAD
ncbi:MAG: hypothetical protein RJA98_2274 [Pseudomonadota bacterium]